MLRKLLLTIAVLAAIGGGVGHTAQAGIVVNPLGKPVKAMTLDEQLTFYKFNALRATHTIAWYHGKGSWTLNGKRYPAIYHTAKPEYDWNIRLLRNATRNANAVEAKLVKKRYVASLCITCWERVASCESGNSWGEVTGNGFYWGLQWTPGTWTSAARNVGLHSFDWYTKHNTFPSEIDQIKAASTISLHNWPVCGARY